MASYIERRKFLATLLGGAAAWPVVVRAQQPAMPVIGYLSSRSPDDTRHLVAAFLLGLNEAGYFEGQNVTIEYRWALGQYDRLPAMAADLVRRPVAILTTSGGEPAALAAKAATSSIPIVFLIGSDPVRAGLVASYNRPGGNITGMNILTDALEAKRLGLLHTLVPQAATIGFLTNPRFASADSQLRDVQEAAHAIGLQIQVLRASTDRELDAAFETITQQRIVALALAADPFFDTRRDKLVTLAARHSVPAIYQFREFVAAGGLMSYGVDSLDNYRQAGVYTGRILKGAKPGDLPILQPTKFEFVINLKTAKTLGLEVPAGVSAMADEVIE
jgi:putative ABC transport system substrate-binding protein